ncbi:TPA: D-alanyl-D-alanine carboxypeptidase family protein [Streptococcus suis]|nr:D-alanyl-D-alanine carboxypeptidase family protein [Streptococcus suis]HEM5491655.1 D-alanyl-D-alanine carboxypeptidase family protein [Streptococcus suis]
MKKLTVSLLLCSSMLLASCGAVENQTESSKVSETNQTVKTSESSSQTMSNSNAESSETGDTENSSTQQSTEMNSATTATYNGSYYSVQGKYGEIIIANKKHPLSPSYAPGENPQALVAFQNLVADMQAQGFAISNNYSGFRSYETQAGLYQSYVNQDGQAAADTYSARAGYSEHQTGLAFDIIDSAGNLLEEPVASKWLADNAHHYGFIVRYLPGKEYSTGYMAETWHVRYIGQEATDIYNSGLTLEEYFGVPGGGYE